MHTIGLWNRKGGVGKTTTAGNLAAELRIHGRTVAVDLDPQANLTSWLVRDPFDHETADVLAGSTTIEQTAIPVRSNLDILPTYAIGGNLKQWSETVLPGRPFAFATLRDQLQDAGYAYAVYDFAPSDRALELFALATMDTIILVSQAEYFSADGIEAAGDTLTHVRENLRGIHSNTRILVNRVNRSYAAHEVLSAEYNSAGYPVDTVGQSTEIHDAVMHHLTLAEYAPGNRYTSVYVDLALEIARNASPA